jgi:cytochrome c biogenesis protein
MAQLSATTNTPRRAPLEIGIDRVWRFFCSVRAAVFEIALLAVLVLIGTLRGSDVPQWIADGVPATQPLVDRWYAWDVFRSSLFAGLLALLSIAIAICTVNRAPAIWQTISNPRVRTSRGYIERAEVNARYVTSSSLVELQTGVSAVLTSKRYRVFTEPVDDLVHFYADKNRWSKLGTFPFHLALILLLVGGIVASAFGFRDIDFAVAEGQTRNVGHNTDLSVELVRFSDTYRETGDAEQYRSEVIIYDDGNKVKQGEITVNHPMSSGVATFYQASFGISADMVVEDANGRQLYDKPLEMGFFNSRDNPDAPAGLIRLPSEGLQVAVVGPDSDRANTPELDTLGLQNGQVWIEVSPIDQSADSQAAPVTAVLDQGTPLDVGGLMLTFERESRFTVLQVAYNPGIPIFIIASLLLVGGLAITFYFPLRRIRGIIEPTETGVQLMMTPLAKRDWGGKREFFDIVDRASTALNTTPTVKRPDDEGNWHDSLNAPDAADESR